MDFKFDEIAAVNDYFKGSMSTSADMQSKMAPAGSLEQLKTGNQRCTSGKRIMQDYAKEVEELFNVRVAGNIVNEDVPGSLEFACHAAGSRLILVLGHTACGAVTAAVQGVELGNLSTLLSKIAPGVDSFGKEMAADVVAEHNVQHSIRRIRKESAILKDMGQAGKILIKGAMYDVATGKVRFPD